MSRSNSVKFLIEESNLVENQQPMVVVGFVKPEWSDEWHEW